MPFDVFCLALLIGFAVWGAFRGFVRQFFGLLGFAGGILLARLAAPSLGEAFGDDLHVSPAVATAALNRVGGALLGASKGFLVVWALASLIALVRPHLKRVERDTPVAKLQLKDSYAVQFASDTNLITRLREGGLQDEAETVRKRLGRR